MKRTDSNPDGRELPAFDSKVGSKRPPVIVVARKYGQLGNCLYLYAHLIAIAREHGARVINPAFGRYARYFRSTAKDVYCRYPVVESRLPYGDRARYLAYQSAYLPTRVLAAIGCKHWPIELIRLRGDEECDLEGDFVDTLHQRGRIHVQGWQFRANNVFANHAAAIREHFRPIETHERVVRKTIQRAREAGDVLVGVHIRQGDYATFQDGAYYYSIEQYRRLMHQVREQLGSREVGFLICSDSPWSTDDFKGLNVTLGSGHLIEDMYALAQCDLLLGPPSTFSGWASIYGQVPLHRIHDPNDEVALDCLPIRQAS